MKSKCPNCNKEFNGDFKFCPQCGKELIVLEETQTAVEPSINKNKHTCATIGFVFGIVSLAVSLIVMYAGILTSGSSTGYYRTLLKTILLITLLTGIAGIVTSSIGLPAKKGFAIPGLITSCINTFFSLIFWLTYLGIY